MLPREPFQIANAGFGLTKFIDNLTDFAIGGLSLLGIYYLLYGAQLMNNNSSLSLEAQGLVRAYILKLLAIPGILVVILSFILGFFIQETAQKGAYQDAYVKASEAITPIIMKTASDAAIAASEAEGAKKNASEIMNEVQAIYEKIKTSELLTSTETQIDSIASNLLAREDFLVRVNSMKEFEDYDRKSNSQYIEVQGGGPWGKWHKTTTFCPANYYVCGLNQKVENEQGAGDDTALNSVALQCCPLFKPRN